MINNDLSGQHAVIIGRSNIVGKPMAPTSGDERYRFNLPFKN